ncbi:MAG TPA: anti-sigma factor [Longimicrobiales bacterium]|nr:anti-sigma factor [Longimicrobiales bacterium]
MEHLNETLINDYLDGLLGPADQSRVESHVAACSSCRAELDALRLVVAQVHGLPREVAPARDLLADIHQRIDAERPIDLASWRHRSLWSLRVPLAAAAMVLVAATFLFTRGFEKGVRAKSQAASPAASQTTLVHQEQRALEGKYDMAIAELQEVIEQQRSRLSPTTIQLLEENLRIIDQAIRESRAALEQDPANPMVNEMLWSAYEKKLDLLRRATASTST